MGCCQSKPGDVQSADYTGAPGTPAAAQAAQKADESPGFFTSMMHNMGSAVSDAVHAVTDPYDVFESKLEIAVIKTLRWISPIAAKNVSTSMKQAVPALEQVEYVPQKAEETVDSHIMEQKDTVLDMCQDFLEDMRSGMKPIKAIKTGFTRVG